MNAAAKIALILLIPAGAALLAFRSDPAAEPETTAPANRTPTPVVVELFTSEGCSSCPPADRLLMELEEQPVAGAEIIVLGFHVDYWNYIGWTDRFSSAEYSQRQGGYAGHFGNSGVYTPQMVVDGEAEFIGSDARRARKVIAKAAAHAKVTIEVRLAQSPSGTGRQAALEVRFPALPRDAEVLLALTEGGLSTQVRRGENAGRILKHTAVVRSLTRIGTAGPAGVTLHPVIELQPEWRRDQLKAVVLIQERASGRILGASALSLAAR